MTCYTCTLCSPHLTILKYHLNYWSWSWHISLSSCMMLIVIFVMSKINNYFTLKHTGISCASICLLLNFKCNFTLTSVEIPAGLKDGHKSCIWLQHYKYHKFISSGGQATNIHGGLQSNPSDNPNLCVFGLSSIKKTSCCEGTEYLLWRHPIVNELNHICQSK